MSFQTRLYLFALTLILVTAGWPVRAVGASQAAAASLPQVSAAAITPADNATGVPINAELAWPGTDAAQYDVYFGTTNPPPFQARVRRPSFVIETLSAGATYYWRVDMVTAGGVKPGQARRFTTTRAATRDDVHAWPIRIATSVRARSPNGGDLGNWNYTEGMIADAMFRIASRTGREDDFTFIKEYLDRYVAGDGSLDPKAYLLELYSLDRIRPAPALLQMYERTGDERYMTAAKYVATQLDKQPRTSEGGYWHRSTYPNQMWLDGIYMADVYAVQFATRTNQPKYYDEAVKQITLIAKHTRDPKTGLFYHGWEETRTRPWANKETGASPEFWGRAIGWYVMAMADIMDGLPPDHPGHKAVLPVFQDLCRSLVKYQDRDTGLWWLIIDKPGAPNNYVETSGTLMFAYGMARGAQRGWLPPEFLQHALRATRGVLNHEVDLLPGNRMDIRGTVQVGSLGGDGGFYDYYVKVPVVTNDQKSVGAFMFLSMALSEIANPAAAAAKEQGRATAAQGPHVWARGVEGQRKADLGNGTFLNPIMAGDHPDPSILKDGDDYYMTFSSFDAYPGLVVWHSRDLVNWQPVGPALFKNVGSVWAPDLVKHQGRYYIYFPGIGSPYRSNYVVWADNIRGPWSEPIDLKIGRIDPGHAVGPDGKRWLFLSAGYLVGLADDGLSVTGEPKKIYDGWIYPEEWVVEGFAQEGPKMLKRGDYYYMVLAEGGTAGPPTSHMVVAARSKTIEGPWENSPYNPVIRTVANDERWWSKGHATLVEGPDRQWYAVYHAYENGFYNLGRQTLLEPIEWTAEGWFERTGADVAAPIRKPAGPAVPHGQALSDDFSTNRMGVQWSFYKGTVSDTDRYRYEHRSLVLKAKGTTPADSSPLWFVTGDHAYEVEVEIDRDSGATAGLLVFYNSRLYAGLGVSDANLVMHRYGMERTSAKPADIGRHVFLRLTNDRHIVTIRYSADGVTWRLFGTRMEVSGYHHNVAYDFLSLRPALYAAGSGEVRFRNFKYRALP